MEDEYYRKISNSEIENLLNPLMKVALKIDLNGTGDC